ncbi:MAG: tRNA pseudouridine(38-40) synthase TruA [Candidatus Methanoplasma sp.]|jgi:tRNA pseudouridine38-40 synthase|nr:tRNA pseudouridine(38-40) synthase TruA [Candidatus Methanoplasma sp.]
MIRVAVRIAYLGKHFSGSQVQPGHRTVEGDVMSDLQKILRMPAEDIDLKLASRTDRGVNSLGNVAVFNSNMEDMDILLKALNAVSEDVFYRSIARVDNEFNPRFADVRRYRYIIPADGMDIAAIKECAGIFTGEHDFIRFCKSECRPTTLTINSIDISRADGIIIVDLSARYYLWNMIRRIAAAMMSVGRGDSEISDVKDALDGKEITFGLARPDALTLLDVSYDGLEFSTPSADMFDRRIEEELFRDRLRNIFFTSL